MANHIMAATPHGKKPASMRKSAIHKHNYLKTNDGTPVQASLFRHGSSTFIMDELEAGKHID
jgi:hypothetical protein